MAAIARADNVPKRPVKIELCSHLNGRCKDPERTPRSYGKRSCNFPRLPMSDVVLCPLDMLSLILSADQTTGCKSTPKAHRTKVQYRTYVEMG